MNNTVGSTLPIKSIPEYLILNNQLVFIKNIGKVCITVIYW